MARSIKVLRRKRGRPATGNAPVTAIRLSPELREQVDAWARRSDVGSRSKAIRELILRGLKASKAKAKAKAKR